MKTKLTSIALAALLSIPIDCDSIPQPPPRGSMPPPGQVTLPPDRTNPRPPRKPPLFPQNYFQGPPWNPGWCPVNEYPGAEDVNQGNITVIGCGFDAMGVWQTVPMKVTYNYNGIRYDVVVNSAWNPWSKFWERGVDVPAVNTDWTMRGVTYKFYVVLSTGTFYFNL